MLHLLDIYLFQMANQWCGNWALDLLVSYEEKNQLFKGGLFLAIIWWFWFVQPEQRRYDARRQIVATLIGVLVTLLLARGIADLAPLRLRPMYAAGLGYKPPSFALQGNMEDWSSFPSDTAALFFGLGFGFWRLSLRLSVLLMAYTVAWICLPRVYLGLHYPSDILAGAGLGIATVWAVSRLMAPGRWLERRVMPFVLGTERRWAALFYSAAFLVSYEMTVMFDDVRTLLRGTLLAARLAGYGTAGEETVLLLITALGLSICGVGWALIVLLHRRREGTFETNTRRGGRRLPARGRGRCRQIVGPTARVASVGDIGHSQVEDARGR